MLSRSVRTVALAVVLSPLLVSNLACGSSDDETTGTGGSSGTSGHPAQGGSSTGGSAGLGGSSAGHGGSSAGHGGSAGAGGGGQAGAGAGGSAGALAAKGLTLKAAGADPSACSFGAQTLGEAAATCVVTLTNEGSKAVTFGAPAVSLAGDEGAKAAFAVTGAPTGMLAAGATTTLSVTFTPGDEGARTATLSVTSDSATGVATVGLKGQGVCPTKGPVDLTKPALAAHCTQTTYVALGGRTRRLVSTDLTTWTHDQLDHTNCLSNDDGTLNCGSSGSFDCSKKDPKECKDMGGGSLDCSYPDPTDPKQTDCTGFDDGAFNAAFGLGLIVTTSDFGIFTSADVGVTWTKAPAPAPQQWGQGSHVSMLAFGNGLFLLVAEGVTFTSPDGYTWTSHSDNQFGGKHFAFGDLAFGGGRFVASGEGTTKVTEDGSSWHDAVDLALNKIAYGNGLFVGAGNGFRVTSPDGTNWQKVTDMCATNPDDIFNWKGPPEQCVGYATTAVWDSKRFVVCGTHCLESPDGKTWTLIDGVHFDYGNPYSFMAFQDGTYFGGGWPGDYVASSTDVVQWTKHSFPGDTVGAGQGMQRVSAGTTLKAVTTSP